MRSSARPRRRTLAATLAGSAAVTALALAPLPAQADFTLPRCGGDNIAGIGASFQAAAQTLFTEQFNVAQPNGCGGTPAIAPFNAAGSGAGRQALGERTGTPPTQNRDPNYRYAAADEAPNPTQRAQIESGPIDASLADVTPADDGKLHVVPVAIGATTIAVHYPEGCTLPMDANDGTGRLKLSADQLEKVFAAQITTWGQLLPTISEVAGGGRAAGACAALPIHRVVRFEDSGTTFTLKAWLQTINGTRGWTGSDLGGTPNTRWPDAGGPASKLPTQGAGACASDLCSNTVKGGGALLDVLNLTTDGGIGYADIRTARSKNFTYSGSTDSTYFIRVQNAAAAGTPYVEATADANGYKPLDSGATAGANCANATFSNLPADTFGNFAPVNAAGSTQGYPLCALTYMLVWDDYAAVYGNTDAEQSKARTVKDYLDRTLSDAVQGLLFSRDYQALPPSILALARAGAAKVGWNKGATGGTPPGGNTPPAATPSPTPTPAATGTPTPPSNVFSVDSARVSKTGVISLTLRLPGAGTVAVAATGPKKLKVGSATGTAKAAGNLKVTIKPSSKTKKALKKTKKLKVSLAVTFTPAGGKAAKQTKKLTLKGKKKGSKKT